MLYRIDEKPIDRNCPYLWEHHGSVEDPSHPGAILLGHCTPECPRCFGSGCSPKDHPAWCPCKGSGKLLGESAQYGTYWVEGFWYWEAWSGTGPTDGGAFRTESEAAADARRWYRENT